MRKCFAICSVRGPLQTGNLSTLNLNAHTALTLVLPGLPTIQTNKQCIRCDLSQVIFTKATLAGVDLSGANLSQATLDQTNLTGAKMIGAKFSTDVSAALFGPSPRFTFSSSLGKEMQVTLTVNPDASGGFTFLDIQQADYRYPGFGGSLSDLQTLSQGKVNAAGTGFSLILLEWKTATTDLIIGMNWRLTSNNNFVDNGLAPWARLTSTGAPIPEPGTWLLLGSGLAGLLGWRMRRSPIESR